jgi:hypothetical protein
MLTKPKLSSLVASQVPEFVRSDYPAFVSFLEAYYEYLETTQQDLGNLRDLDKTLDGFVRYFKDELASKLPYSTVDQRFLMQHIKEHYGAKGSESSYKLLFRILFGKEVAIDYPAKQMLRASDGKWNQDVSIFVKILTGNPTDPIGKYVDVVTPTKIIRVLVDRRQYVELEIDRVVKVSENVYEYFIDRRFFGNISVGDRLRYRDDVNGIYFTGEILATTTTLEVQKSGTGFKVGDLYNIKNYDGYGSIMKVVRVSSTGGILQAQFIKFGVGYTTDFTTTISAKSGQDVSGTAGTTIQRIDIPQAGGHTLTNLTITDRMDGFSESGTINTADYSLPAQPVSYTGTVAVTNNSSILTGTGTLFTTQFKFGDTITLPAGVFTVGRINSDTSLVLVESPAVLTGVVAVTNNNATVLGVGTLFTTEVAVGDEISLPNGVYTVQSITNDTTLVLTSTYTGSTQTALPATGFTPTVYTGATASGITPYAVTRPPVLDGAFAGIVLREFGISNVDATATNVDPAIIKCTLGPLAKYPGYYVNNDGFLDDAIFIQDSRYYQAYSYVIKIDEALDSYKTAVKNLIHPAGMAVFGEYDIRNEFDISETLESLIKILNIVAKDSVTSSTLTEIKDIAKYFDDQTLNGDLFAEGQYVTIQELGIALDGTRTMPYLTLSKPIDGTNLNYNGVVESQSISLADGGDVTDLTRTMPYWTTYKQLDVNHVINDNVTTDSESVYMLDETGSGSTRTGPYIDILNKPLGLVDGVNTHLNADLVYDNESILLVENAIGYGYSGLVRTGADIFAITKALSAGHYINDNTTTDNEGVTVTDTDASSASDLNRTIPAISLTTTFGVILNDGVTADSNVATATDSGGTMDLNPYGEAGWFLNDGGLYVGNPITFTG